MQNMIIKDLFILNNKLKRLLDKTYQVNDIRTGQARVLIYLYKEKEKQIYQKQLEEVFQIRGGTVTGMIDTLERDELIKRTESNEDKRKKEVILTQKGIEIAKKSIKTNQIMESKLSSILNLEEIETIKNVFHKINLWIDMEENNEKTI
ncbi:MarR family winged helix-turn-helix transcriptional regulator [Acholeplasma granularum]|uniref:MarR family winged helix-turn-helix transcriptional regulator n=1 Tax=Acholeplasma granularum TaxID=264635 RepID=UPI0004706878|nr:MarR family transcriptional regulator [Acholeplasma granularum]